MRENDLKYGLARRRLKNAIMVISDGAEGNEEAMAYKNLKTRATERN